LVDLTSRWRILRPDPYVEAVGDAVLAATHELLNKTPLDGRDPGDLWRINVTSGIRRSSQS
jgi:hypothetical protein